MTYFATSEDGVWAEVETAGGTRGWLRAQYLQTEVPIANRFSEVEQALAVATERAELAEAAYVRPKSSHQSPMKRRHD